VPAGNLCVFGQKSCPLGPTETGESFRSLPSNFPLAAIRWSFPPLLKTFTSEGRPPGFSFSRRRYDCLFRFLRLLLHALPVKQKTFLHFDLASPWAPTGCPFWFRPPFKMVVHLFCSGRRPCRAPTSCFAFFGSATDTRNYSAWSLRLPFLRLWPRGAKGRKWFAFPSGSRAPGNKC